jgi:hypothetical protein
MAGSIICGVDSESAMRGVAAPGCQGEPLKDALRAIEERQAERRMKASVRVADGAATNRARAVRLGVRYDQAGGVGDAARKNDAGRESEMSVIVVGVDACRDPAPSARAGGVDQEGL